MSADKKIKSHLRTQLSKSAGSSPLSSPALSRRVLDTTKHTTTNNKRSPDDTLQLDITTIDNKPSTVTDSTAAYSKDPALKSALATPPIRS